jgi:segregation and condensation protein B
MANPQSDNPVDNMTNPNLDNIVLALLFASEEALSARKIAAIVEDVTTADVKQSIESLNERSDAESWSIGIEQVAGGYRLTTRAEYAPYVHRLYTGRRKVRLSRAGLETLAIIAYKQPVTRAEIESIRGVGCGSVVANLLERSLVQITGKAKVLGAPFLYGTTPEFLEYLGLNSLRDLPAVEDLEALLAAEGGEAAVEGDGAPAPAANDYDGDDVMDDMAAVVEAALEETDVDIEYDVDPEDEPATRIQAEPDVSSETMNDHDEVPVRAADDDDREDDAETHRE